MVCVLLALGGCQGSPATPEAAALPFQGQQVRLGYPERGAFPEVWEGPLQEWSAQTGGTVELVPFAPDGGPSAASAATEPPFPDVDLLVFPTTSAAGWLQEDRLAPIPETQRADERLGWEELFTGLREAVPARAGPVWLPLSQPVLVCYFRADLLDKAGLKPPQTWDEYHALLARLPEWAPGQTAVEPWGPEFRATTFLAKSVGYAKHSGHYSLFFDIETGRPLIDSPGFVRGLEQCSSAWKLLPAEVRTYGPRECRAALLSGKAALGLTLETGPGNPPPESFSRTAEGGATSPRAEEVQLGFARLPGAGEVYNPSARAWEPQPAASPNAITLSGFAGYAAAVSAEAAGRDAAWNLLIFLTRSDAAAFPPGVLGLTRDHQALSPGAWVGTELRPGEAARYVDVVARSLRDRRHVVELPVVGRRAFREALATALEPALEGRITAAEALQRAAAAWAGIVAERGAKTIRDSYRRGLGLPPPLEATP